MKKRVKGKKINGNKRKVGKWLYWSPRVLTILFILFISMFSLDIFGNNYTFWETVVGLLMHNIPTFILLIFLIVAWKYEWLGAVGFFLFAVGYIIMILRNPFQWYLLAWSLEIVGPAIIIGVLWWMNWKRKR